MSRRPRSGRSASSLPRAAGFGAAAGARGSQPGGGAAARLQAGLRENELVGAVPDAACPGGAVLSGQPDPGRRWRQRCAALPSPPSSASSRARWSTPRSARAWARSSPEARRRTSAYLFEPQILGPILGLCGAGGPADRDPGLRQKGHLTWTRIETDICVIGAGSGGLSVAAGAVQMGARVVLIEGGRDGRRLPEPRLRAVEGAARGGQGGPCA